MLSFFGILIICTIILSGYLIYGWDFNTFRWSFGLYGWDNSNVYVSKLQVINNNFTFITLFLGSMVAFLLVRFSYLSYLFSYFVIMIFMKFIMQQPGYDVNVMVLVFFFVFVLSFIVLIPSLLIKIFVVLSKEERIKLFKNLNIFTHVSIFVYLLLASSFLFYVSITPIFKSILDNNSLGLVGYIFMGFISIATTVIAYWCIKNIFEVLKKKV